LGARPLIHFEDEASYWQAVRDGRASVIGSPGEHEWAALEKTDVYVYFWGPESLARRSRLPDRTASELTRYNSRWYEVARKSEVRGVRMAIARVTEENARFWGVPFVPWRREVLAASMRDPTSLGRDAERVRRVLSRGRSIRLRHPNGTDLTLALAGRPVQVATGELTPASRKSAFGQLANVPDGSVYVAVDEGTAEGTIVANRATSVPQGRQEGGRFRFSNGRLESFDFSEGGPAFRAAYRGAGAGRDRPSFLEVGLNPDVRTAPGLEEAGRGAVTIGVGQNASFGGKTKVDFLGYVTIAGADLTVDGRPLVRHGRLR
jgi:leucyl aminopeptidase (aminopeptidase T)